MGVFRQPPNIRPALLGVAAVFGIAGQIDNPSIAKPPVQAAHAAFYAPSTFPRQAARLNPATLTVTPDNPPTPLNVGPAASVRTPYLYPTQVSFPWEAFAPPDSPPLTTRAPASAFVRTVPAYPAQMALPYENFSPPDSPLPGIPIPSSAYARSAAPVLLPPAIDPAIFAVQPPDSPQPRTLGAPPAAYVRDLPRPPAPRPLEIELLDYYEADGAVGIPEPQTMAAAGLRPPVVPVQRKPFPPALQTAAPDNPPPTLLAAPPSAYVRPSLNPPAIMEMEFGVFAPPDAPPAPMLGLRTAIPCPVPMPTQLEPLGPVLENLGDATPAGMPLGLRTPASPVAVPPAQARSLAPILENLGDPLPPAAVSQYRPVPAASRPAALPNGIAASLPPDAPPAEVLAAPASAYQRPQPPYPTQQALPAGIFAIPPGPDSPQPYLPVQQAALAAWRAPAQPGRQLVPLNLQLTLPDAPPLAVNTQATLEAWRPAYSPARILALPAALVPVIPDDPPVAIPSGVLAQVAWRAAAGPGRQTPPLSLALTVPDAPPMLPAVRSLGAWQRPGPNPVQAPALNTAVFPPVTDPPPLRVEAQRLALTAWRALAAPQRLPRWQMPVARGAALVDVSLATPVYIAASLETPLTTTVNLETPLA